MYDSVENESLLQHTTTERSSTCMDVKQCLGIDANNEMISNGLVSHQEGKLSTFFGVIVPCCLSMFSVILFLRMGFIVGEAGLYFSLVMLVLAYTIICFTVLSICAISTNGAVQGGGAYFMISRALGPEFGGAIGLMFFLANIAATALYIFGIVEAIISYFGHHLPDMSSNPYWWRYLFGTAILILCLIVCIVGAELYAKTTFIIFLVVMASISSVLLSFFLRPAFTMKESTLTQCNTSTIPLPVNYTGLNADTLRGNLYPNFTTLPDNDGHVMTITKLAAQAADVVMYSFISVFAVLFNGCTGIMAGANMSGDLKNPSKSIPTGTIAACMVTFFVYTILLVLVGATTPRLILQCDWGFLYSVNVWPPFIVIGVFASSLSAAFSCLIGASRILLALARDEIFGILLSPMKRTTSSGNPITCVIASWFLVQMMLFFGGVNMIAPVVTVFFLFSYAATDLACLSLELASAPNFRPTFRLFTWHTCLLGLLSCLIMTVLINYIYTVVSVLVIIILFIIIHYKVPETSWGYISQALIFHQVRKYMLMLDTRKEHVKFWRPQMLLMVKNPRTCCQLIDFINSIKKSGLYVLGHVSIGHLADMKTDALRSHKDHWLDFVDRMGVKAFVELTLSRSVREGSEHLLRLSGLGGMKPNTLVLGFYDESPPQDTFKQMKLFNKHLRNTSPTNRYNEEAPDEEPFFLLSNKGHSHSVEEHVAIMADTLKLGKNICLARYFNQLDKATIFHGKKPCFIDVWPINFIKSTQDRTSSNYSSTENGSILDTTSVFLMQMACILNMAQTWKKNTKLRIFLLTNENDDQAPRELQEFLYNVRINAEIKEIPLSRLDMIDQQGGHNSSLTDESMYKSFTNPSYDYDKNTRNSNEQVQYIQRVNSLIRSQLESTAVTFLYLPAPPIDTSQYQEYHTMLTSLTDDVGPSLLIHGQTHVVSTSL